MARALRVAASLAWLAMSAPLARAAAGTAASYSTDFYDGAWEGQVRLPGLRACVRADGVFAFVKLCWASVAPRAASLVLASGGGCSDRRRPPPPPLSTLLQPHTNDPMAVHWMAPIFRYA